MKLVCPRRVVSFIIAVAAVFISGCSNGNPVSVSNPSSQKPTPVPTRQVTEIELESTAALGASYAISISREGKAQFSPKGYSGYGTAPEDFKPVTRTLRPGEMDELVQTIESNGFFDLRERYSAGDQECPNHIDDGGSLRIRVMFEGGSKEVSWTNCYRDSSIYPGAIASIKDAIRKAVGSPI